MRGIVMWTIGRYVDYLDPEACIHHIDLVLCLFLEEEDERHCCPIGLFVPGA